MLYFRITREQTAALSNALAYTFKLLSVSALSPNSITSMLLQTKSPTIFQEKNSLSPINKI